MHHLRLGVKGGEINVLGRKSEKRARFSMGLSVRINDSVMMLAPGVTIRDMYNRMVLPNTVRQPKKIRYTLDLYGQVRRIWISPTGEYMGRHQPTLPPEPRKE